MPALSSQVTSPQEVSLLSTFIVPLIEVKAVPKLATSDALPKVQTSCPNLLVRRRRRHARRLVR